MNLVKKCQTMADSIRTKGVGGLVNIFANINHFLLGQELVTQDVGTQECAYGAKISMPLARASRPRKVQNICTRYLLSFQVIRVRRSLRRQCMLMRRMPEPHSRTGWEWSQNAFMFGTNIEKKADICFGFSSFLFCFIQICV